MIQETINLLGLKATDKVTGFSGVIGSVGFDLYGCVTVAINPPVDDKGGLVDGRWFDVNRVEVGPPSSRVMPVPVYAAKDNNPENYRHGAADKPAPK